jgi:integrase
MEPGPRVWRVTTQQKAKGTYWSLQTGARGKGRIALALGYCDELNAERALKTINREEVELFGKPQYDRILRMYARDQNEARDYLFGDPAIETFADPKPDAEIEHRFLPLRMYVDNHYGPRRKASKPIAWRNEKFFWIRINEAIGDTRLCDIDEYVVDRYLRDLKNIDGTPASWNTKRQHRNAFAACLEWARREGHRKGPKPQWFRLEGMPKRVVKDVLTLEEATKLLDACDPQTRCILAMGLGCGMRPNEIVRCRWEDVDWKRGAIFVRGSKTDESSATVPLLPIALVEIQKWHAASGRPTEGTMFRPRKRGRYAEYRTGETGAGVSFRRALATAVKRSKLEKRITPYTLRHTCATWLVERNVPIQSVAKLLRHTNPRMLEQHYDHTGAVRAPGLMDLAPRLPADGTPR